ncbi:hypothetical protein [Aeromonas tecta]|uniref:hypothetical protein n=1 Tax=Aeromonas tecta TaxID=324617 RepID=UPI0006821BDB|nr:hypothetical protein [Aeromonas tecta]
MIHDITQTEQLVEQLRQAHRLVAGFYQRILPLFDQIAQESIDATFWYWKPSENGRPCSGSSRPSSSWVWDYIPLFASTHGYRTWDGDKARAGDMTLALRLYIDDAFKKGSFQRGNSKGMPDPLELKMGKAVVEVNLFRCTQDSELHFDELWSDIPWPEPTEQWTTAAQHQEVEYCVWHVPLAELLADPAVVTRWIKSRLG